MKTIPYTVHKGYEYSGLIKEISISSYRTRSYSRNARNIDGYSYERVALTLFGSAVVLILLFRWLMSTNED